MTTYLDCNATTPLDPRVREAILLHLDEEYGNAGSRTHAFGTRAKQAVEHARRQVAAVVAAKAEDVTFTSGATESDNLAILGLEAEGLRSGRRHMITTAIEHKAVLEPCEELARRGWDVTVLPVTEGGFVDPGVVHSALRPDTLLVSVMHANNETGILQPLAEIAKVLGVHGAYFHVDAAQGFGKDLDVLRDERIDMISVSGHKLYAPKGVGALITRRRGFNRIPLQPLQFGGGQERGLRPGTLPVHLIAGLGVAAEIAQRDAVARRRACEYIRAVLVPALLECGGVLHGDQDRAQPHVINVAFPGIDSEAAMLAWKDVVAVSNGSACTSQKYTPSHVLLAMGLDRGQVDGALRLSWSHLTPMPDVNAMVSAIRALG